MHVGMSLTAVRFQDRLRPRTGGVATTATTDLKAVDLGAAFSYDVNPYVSFGASVFVEHLTIELANALDMGAIVNSGAQDKAEAQLRELVPNLCSADHGRTWSGRPAGDPSRASPRAAPTVR